MPAKDVAQLREDVRLAYQKYDAKMKSYVVSAPSDQAREMAKFALEEDRAFHASVEALAAASPDPRDKQFAAAVRERSAELESVAAYTNNPISYFRPEFHQREAFLRPFFLQYSTPAAAAPAVGVAGAAALTPLEAARAEVVKAKAVFDSTYASNPPTAIANYVDLSTLARDITQAQSRVIDAFDAEYGRPPRDSAMQPIMDAEMQLHGVYKARHEAYAHGHGGAGHEVADRAKHASLVEAAEEEHDAVVNPVAVPAPVKSLDELRKEARAANVEFNKVMSAYKNAIPQLAAKVPDGQAWADSLAGWAMEAYDKQVEVVKNLTLQKSKTDLAKEQALLAVLKSRKEFWEAIRARGDGVDLLATEVGRVEPHNTAVQEALDKANELTLYDKTIGEFMNHAYMSGETSTTKEETQHLIYNFWNPAHSIITRPFVDMWSQIKYTWAEKPYLVPVIVLFGLPVNILNHVLPFKVDFRFPFLHLGTPQVPPIIRDIFKAVSNLASFACNGVGLVINSAFKALAFVSTGLGKIFDTISKGIDKARPNGKVLGFLYSATFGTIATIFKAAAVPCHVAGKALDATGSVAQNACAIAGSACQILVHPKEAIKGVGQNLVGTYATVVQGVGEVVKETGLQLNQFANTANIPIVSNAIKVGGNVLAAVGVGIEAGGVGTKLFAKGDVKEGGTVIAAGMGAGAKTIYEGIKPHTIDDGGLNPHSIPTLKESPEFFLMPNKNTGNKIASMKMGPDQVDAAELLKGTKINTSLMTASKQAEVDKVRHEAEEARKKERGEGRVSR